MAKSIFGIQPEKMGNRHREINKFNEIKIKHITLTQPLSPSPHLTASFTAHQIAKLT